EIFDVSDPSQPEWLSDYQPYPTGCWPERITDIAFAGTHAFVTTERCGLAVVEISDPGNPQVLAHEEIRGGARSLNIAGNHVYLGGSGGGLRVVDVSAPGTPSVSGTFRRVGVFSSMALHNDLLYAPTTHGLHRIDVSNPHQPAQSAYRDQAGNEIVLAGNYGYLTRRSGSDSEPSELRILDLSTLQTVGALDIPGYTDDHLVVGDYAYVGTIQPPTYTLQLHVVDVSNPAAPQARGTYDVGEPEPYSLYLAAEDDVLYVTAGGDLHLFDISDPTALQALAAPEIPAPKQIVVKNGYAYIRTGSLSVSNGLYILDVSTPTSPTIVGSYAEDDLWTSASSMDVSSDYAYVGTYDFGLFVFDIRDPTNPLPLGRIQDRGRQRINDVLVDGQYIYAADAAQGLRVLQEAGFGTITGQMLKAPGEGMYGDLRVDGAVDVATDASGAYTVTVPAGCHTVAPWTWYYIWDPASRRVCVTADSTVENVDFIARNILKSVTPTGPAGYGDVLTYTLQLASGSPTDMLVMDEIPTHTTYISNSLSGPAGLVYDPALDAITGTLSLGALDPVTVSFAVRVEVTGTQQSAPIITNRAYMEADTSYILAQWSNEVRTFTYAHRVYLPLTLRAYP
ncbi:MAG: LVIVD repeat-containing protein, partial [Anaerolineales bacterium]